MEGKNIVISGIGVVSSAGIGKSKFWINITGGLSGIKKISLFDTTGLTSCLAGQIEDLNESYYLGKKNSKYLSRENKMLLIAAELALEDSHMLNNSDLLDKAAVVVGTSTGNLSKAIKFTHDELIDGPDSVSPMDFSRLLHNSLAGSLSMFYGIKGMNSTITTGSSSGLDIIDYAAQMIRNNYIDIALVGSSFTLNDKLYKVFCDLGILSGSGGSSQETCCPFDSKRNGTILGEGAAILILENKEHLEKRKGHGIAKVLGWANRVGFRNSIFRDVMQSALDKSKVDIHDIDYLSASGNGSIRYDRLEINSLKNLMPSDNQIFVNSIKPIIGDCYSANGVFQVAVACLSMEDSLIPATLNFKESEIDLGKIDISGKAISREVRKSMINSFGCDGYNSSIVLSKYE